MLRHLFRRRTRRGIATILGMLLIVGILFTSIIPLYLYINQVNNYYDRTVVEMTTADQERSMENLQVYAWGHNDTSKAVDVFMVNRGGIAVTVTHVWAMRRDLQKTLLFTSANLSSLPLELDGAAQTTISNINLEPIIEDNAGLDYFNIEVATGRGNKYPSQTNSLHKTEGGWENTEPQFEIDVVVHSERGLSRYRVDVVGADDGTKSFSFTTESLQLQNDFFTIVRCPKVGSYNVTVWRMKGGTWSVKVAGPDTVVLTWLRPYAVRKYIDTELIISPISLTGTSPTTLTEYAHKSTLFQDHLDLEPEKQP